MLELLQSRTQISGAELARRVGVDRRTLRRYIATLEEIGIPISAEYGPHGGYRVMPGFKLPPMMFTDEEAQALSLGLLAARELGLAGIAPAIESAEAKLARVMPERCARAARGCATRSRCRSRLPWQPTRNCCASSVARPRRAVR